jgi:hypothetical protein
VRRSHGEQGLSQFLQTLTLIEDGKDDADQLDSINDSQRSLSDGSPETKDSSKWNRHSCLCLITFKQMPEDQRFYQYKCGSNANPRRESE